MIRVLVYGMTNNCGGIEAYIMNNFRQFDRRNVVFDFVTDYTEIAYADEIESLGGKVYFVPTRKQNLFRHLNMIRKIVKDNKYKIIYYNILSSTGALSLVSLLFMKKPVRIVHSHNNCVKRRWLHNLFKPCLSILSDYMLACSMDAGVFMFGKRNVNKRKVQIKNNAIDCKAFAYNPEIRTWVRKELNVENKRVIGFVGRLCYQKNPIFLLDIFCEMRKKRDDIILLLIGDGEDRESVIKHINYLNLKNDVILMGMRDDVPDLLQAMDAFLLPSRFEGFPFVLLEAQACGLPTFTSENIIPKEAKITKLLEFVALQETAQNWADEIIAVLNYERVDYSASLIKAGYDIKTESENFQAFFINCIKP